jgi:protocatechuate 3,4-dioxygenase beta subunit
MELHDHDHDGGLAADLAMMLKARSDRRQSMRWLLAGAATLPGIGLVSCGGSDDSSATTTTTAASSSSTSTTTATTTATTTTDSTSSSSTSSTSCSVIPEETGGPYPADGTNSNSSGVVNVLTLADIVRSDIRSSIDGASGTAAGVPLTIRLELVNANNSCADLEGYAVYLWHCTRDGLYSLYSSGVTNQNYLRGVQASDASGMVAFTTIFPGCYSGRMTHVHFEIYPSIAKATSAANRIKTSQLTFPLATLNEVYAVSGYSASVTNLAQISYATDNVFSDGYSLQMTTVTGNTTDGYVATLRVAVSG